MVFAWTCSEVMVLPFSVIVHTPRALLVIAPMPFRWVRAQWSRYSISDIRPSLVLRACCSSVNASSSTTFLYISFTVAEPPSSFRAVSAGHINSWYWGTLVLVMG